MGPKKVKDVSDDNNYYWRIPLEEAVLESETWKVKVVLIEAAGSDPDRIYLNKFETYAAQEKRFVIKNVCKTETIFMINQLGGEKKVKDDSLRVFEEAQAFLKEKKNIPSDILALLIKHLILNMKREYLFIKRQKLAVKEGVQNESATMIDKAEVRGTVAVKAVEMMVPVNNVKNKNKTGDVEIDELREPIEDKKYNTSLRVRGEEWRDKVYIDDFPVDGPNLYVAITGFMDPYLAGCLLKIGVPITAIVQIRINPATVKIPSNLFRATKRGQSQSELQGEKCLMFWNDLQSLRIKSDCDVLKNTAFVVFSPPLCKEEGLSGDHEKIYDEISYLLYDIQDLTRQHVHYLNNLHVISIPEERCDVILKQKYDSEMQLPLESTTLFSILDSILKTVSKSKGSEENKSQFPTTNSTTNASSVEKQKLPNIETFVKDVFDNLCLTNIHKNKYRVTQGNEYEQNLDPTIILFGDLSRYSTFHLKEVNLQNIILSTLYNFPVNKLWQYFNKQPEKREARVNFHVNVLLSCFDRKNLEKAELNRLMHILSFRKLYNNRSCLKKEHLPNSTISHLKKKFLKRSQLAEPLNYMSWSDVESSSTSLLHQSSSNTSIEALSNPVESTSSLRRLLECPELSELVSASEILIKHPLNHMIDDFEYFEEFTENESSQVLRDAYNKFNCVNYKYCEASDSLILMFFNSHSDNGISREEWRGHIPTPVFLQDFFDFILEEHYDWIQNEENIYDQIMATTNQDVSKDLKKSLFGTSCVDDKEVETELIMEGSLKHQDLEERELVENDESLESKVTSSKKLNSPVSPLNLDSKSNKKTKTSVPSTPKNLVQPFIASPTDSKYSSVTCKKIFNGYNLCDRRVEAFGKDTAYFSKDGSKVFSKYISLIPSNVEYITLKVVPGNSCNEVWMHRILDENYDSFVPSTGESLRICTLHNLSIYVKKETFLVPILPNCTKSKESIVKSSLNANMEEKSEISFNSLTLTWPSGLITQTVNENNSSEISHIKQFYVSPFITIKEDMRCISMTGEVILFNKDGSVEVLQPAGVYLNITKLEKRIKGGLIQEDIQSDASSVKTKRSKGKDSTKSTKASTKTSVSEWFDEKEADTKKIEYELIIEDYEIIHTNGLRQKCVMDKVFDIERLLTRTATDYCIGEIFSKRSDGTNILLNKDGKLIITYPNNTRIITSFVIESDEIYPEWSEEEMYDFGLNNFIELETASTGTKQSSSEKINETLEELTKEKRDDGYVSVCIIYSIEHPYFTTVTINKANDKITIDSPNNTCVTITKDNKYEFKLDGITSANFDGQILNINYKTCPECPNVNKCTVNINPGTNYEDMNNTWLFMKDSFGKNVVVNVEGEISILEDQEKNSSRVDYLDEEHESIKSNLSCGPHMECTRLMEAKSFRFFSLKRDLTCAELVHRDLVEEYKQTCQALPWCSVNNYQSFGDYRSLSSILTPIYRTESEKWMMDSKLANKPKYLVYKDLKHDDGKGFYHWMRPYKRFDPKPITPENCIPDGLPRAYILRTLERQWSDINKEQLKGAKELVRALLKYRDVMESNSQDILNIPIRDFTLESEKKSNEAIQKIAHRVYEDLKRRIGEDIQSRAKPTITTKASPKDGFTQNEDNDEIRTYEDIHRDLLHEVEVAAEMSPKLKRYWCRRNEEYKKEQFYKRLLREGSVPPYFRNVLGGAIWWDINHAAGVAVKQVEGGKVCVCPEDTSTSKTLSL